MKKFLSLLTVILMMLSILCGCEALLDIEDADSTQPESAVQVVSQETVTIAEDGYYTSPEDVAAYLRTYKHLPNNYITKSEAEKLGWDSSKGNLWEVTDKKSIGGDRFGNREGKLPKAEGRQYYECDVNYNGGFRGAERLVYSNDGLIYYTKDHYESFTLMEDTL